MEQLKQYLVGKPKAAFAASVSINPAYLSQILSGRKTPSLALMCRIEEATNGVVTRMHWTPARPSPEACDAR